MLDGDAFIYEKLRHQGATLLTVHADQTKFPAAFGKGGDGLSLRVVCLQPDGILAQQLAIDSGGVALIRPDSYIAVISKDAAELSLWLSKM